VPEKGREGGESERERERERERASMERQGDELRSDCSGSRKQGRPKGKRVGD